MGARGACLEANLTHGLIDILPLRPGHTLIIPKTHISHVSNLPPEVAAAMGTAVSKVAKALTQGRCGFMMWTRMNSCLWFSASQNTALNIVCNQEYAQSVPHVRIQMVFARVSACSWPRWNIQVHYHIIPAPQFEASQSDPPRIGAQRQRVAVPRTMREMHQLEYEGRSELDQDEGRELAERIRARL